MNGISLMYMISMARVMPLGSSLHEVIFTLSGVFHVVCLLTDPRFAYISSVSRMSALVIRQLGSFFLHIFNVIISTRVIYCVLYCLGFTGVSVHINCIFTFNAIYCVN